MSKILSKYNVFNLILNHYVLPEKHQQAFLHNVQAGHGVHKAFYSMTSDSFFPGLKWPGSKADKLSPSNFQIKN